MSGERENANSSSLVTGHWSLVTLTKKQMNTKKLEIKIAKLDLQPGDIVLVTVPAITRQLKDGIGENLRQMLGPDTRILMLQEPVSMTTLAELLTAEDIHALTVAWERRHPQHVTPMQMADGKWRTAGAEISKSNIQPPEKLQAPSLKGAGHCRLQPVKRKPKPGWQG